MLAHTRRGTPAPNADDTLTGTERDPPTTRAQADPIPGDIRSIMTELSATIADHIRNGRPSTTEEASLARLSALYGLPVQLPLAIHQLLPEAGPAPHTVTTLLKWTKDIKNEVTLIGYRHESEQKPVSSMITSYLCIRSTL
jgi:hypothetical protein